MGGARVRPFSPAVRSGGPRRAARWLPSASSSPRRTGGRPLSARGTLAPLRREAAPAGSDEAAPWPSPAPELLPLVPAPAAPAPPPPPPATPDPSTAGAAHARGGGRHRLPAGACRDCDRLPAHAHRRPRRKPDSRRRRRAWRQPVRAWRARQLHGRLRADMGPLPPDHTPGSRQPRVRRGFRARRGARLLLVLRRRSRRPSEGLLPLGVRRLDHWYSTRALSTGRARPGASRPCPTIAGRSPAPSAAPRNGGCAPSSRRSRAIPV